MRTRRRNILLILAAAMCVSVVSFLAYDRGFFSGSRRAEFLVRDHLADHGTKRLRDYSFHATRLGKRSWLVGYGLIGVQPSIGSCYLVDSNGTALPMSPESLSKVMRGEFRPQRSDPGHDEFLLRFITLLHSERAEIISSPSDIPDHASAPLPPEMAALIRAPEDTEHDSHVFFTYQGIGGHVRRYEFQYEPDGAFIRAGVTSLGSRIGAAMYYQ